MKLLSFSLFATLLLVLPLSLGALASPPDVGSPTAEAMPPEISIDGPDTITICRGDTIQLTQTNNVDNANLMWGPAEGFLSSTSDPSPSIAPIVSRFYRVSVSNDDGVAADSVYVNVNQLVVPQLIGDTTVCQGLALPLVQSPVDNSRGTVYRYSPRIGFDNVSDVNGLITPQPGQPRTYTLISTSADMVCADTQMVTISVTPSRLEITEEDTVFRCNDEAPLSLFVTAAPAVSGGSQITWFPREGIISEEPDGSITVQPMNDRTYFVTAEVNGCPQTDSVHIRVDSLPADLSLTSEPVKDPFCIGDTFNLRGTVFDVGDFPLITHRWISAIGIQSPEELYQGVFIAQDSALYQRQDVNGACVDTAEIQINVIQPPILIFEPDPAIACPGEPLQLNVSFDPTAPSGELEWMDPAGTLSCTDCLDPVVITDQTQVYEITVTAEGSECSSPESFTVQIADDASPALTAQRTICAGDAIQLITGNIMADFTYQISGGGQVLLDPEATVSPAVTTTYTIETTNPAFDESSACGTISQEITINVAGNYDVILDSPTTICPGESVRLSARTEPPTPGAYVFTYPGGTTEGPEATVEVTMSGTVEVTFVDAAGCNTVTESATIDLDQNVLTSDVVATTTSGAAVNGTSVIKGGEIVLTLSGLPDDFSGRIEWVSTSGGEPAQASGRSITVTAPDRDGSFAYNVSITPEVGCPISTFVSFELVDEPFDIPEIISANRDGVNDNFQVFFAGGAAVEDFTLLIYNRFGQEVFNTSDPTESWDGTKSGAPQNLGTYLYLTKFSIAGQEFEREGQFSLVR